MARRAWEQASEFRKFGALGGCTRRVPNMQGFLSGFGECSSASLGNDIVVCNVWVPEITKASSLEVAAVILYKYSG